MTYWLASSSKRRKKYKIVSWCNGNTKDFGPFVLSSSLREPTMKKLTIKVIEESIELLNNSEPNRIILIGLSRKSIEEFDNAVRECLYNSTG